MTNQSENQKVENAAMDVMIDANKSVVILEPKQALSKADFSVAEKALTPFIREHGELKGIVIKTREFPGWESFDDLSEHFDFVKTYHDKIARVALVTDAPIAKLAKGLGEFLVEAEVKHFDYSDAANAERWVAAA